jgi:hypothetical protein
VRLSHSGSANGTFESEAMVSVLQEIFLAIFDVKHCSPGRRVLSNIELDDGYAPSRLGSASGRVQRATIKTGHGFPDQSKPGIIPKGFRGLR